MERKNGSTKPGASAANEDEFLARLRETPNDDDTRLVYADWLEEHSRVAQSQFLRFQARLRSMSVDDPKFEFMGVQLRNMASLLDPKWRAVVAYTPIDRCEAKFDFPCPKQWSALEKGSEGADTIRFCGSCKKDVYYATSMDEAYEHARAGHCVAIDPVQLRIPGDLEDCLARSASSSFVPMAGAVMVPETVLVSEDEPAKPSLLDRVRSFFVR